LTIVCINCNCEEKETNKLELFKELIERSQSEKRGLSVYFGGNQIVGIATGIINEQAVELRSQQFHKAVVLLETIDAMAVN
jgi:hypothetical protein